MRRAIVLENELAFAEKLNQMLISLGYEAVVSTDARLSYATSLQDTDIVFVDIQRPQFSGRQVLEQLAHQKAKSPIILMSSHFDRLEIVEKLATKLNLNLIGALEKSFGLEDLRDVLPGPS